MNIKQLAAHAGVSVATISRVINDQPGVRDSVRAKVKAIIKETDYRPNLIAKALIRKKSAVVGLVVPLIDSYYSERINAFIDVLSENDYGVMIANSMLSHEKEIKNIRMLQEKQVDGVIFFGSSMKPEMRDEVIKEINSSIKVVLIDIEIDGIPAVLQNDYSGGFKAVSYLIEKGCREIGFIGGLLSHRSTTERFRGYLKALSDAGIVQNDNLVRYGDFTTESGYEEGIKLLNEEKVDSIFVVNDNTTLGVFRAIKDKGYSIPGDISVISVDDMPYSKYLNPSLTTVRQDQYETGRQAAWLLLKRLEDSETVENIILKQSLIVRESVRGFKDN